MPRLMKAQSSSYLQKPLAGPRQHGSDSPTHQSSAARRRPTASRSPPATLCLCSAWHQSSYRRVTAVCSIVRSRSGPPRARPIAASWSQFSGESVPEAMLFDRHGGEAQGQSFSGFCPVWKASRSRSRSLSRWNGLCTMSRISSQCAQHNHIIVVC